MKIREAMDAMGARDIAQIRASTVTGGLACARCGCNTVHGQTAGGRWCCRDTETCASNGGYPETAALAAWTESLGMTSGPRGNNAATITEYPGPGVGISDRVTSRKAA